MSVNTPWPADYRSQIETKLEEKVLYFLWKKFRKSDSASEPLWSTVGGWRFESVPPLPYQVSAPNQQILNETLLVKLGTFSIESFIEELNSLAEEMNHPFRYRMMGESEADELTRQGHFIPPTWKNKFLIRQRVTH